MNAVEFVKKHGWEYARHILSDDAPIVVGLDCNELKRLIESWELIEKLGGLIKAKEVYQQYWNSGVGSAMGHAIEIEQAIKLVEQVNESKNQNL